MAKKRPRINIGGLKGSTSDTHLHPVEVLEHQKAGRQKSRIGKSNITGYFPADFKKKFKQLALDQGKSAQDLLEEGIKDLFKKYKVH